MKRLVLVTILGLVSAFLAPTLVSHLYSVPHRHMLVGNVSAADMDAHLESERGEPTPAAAETRLTAGFILSIPFGDLATLFLSLGMCLLIGPGRLGVVAFSTRVLIHSPFLASPLFSPTVPPPRGS